MSAGAAAGIAIGGLGLLVGIVGLVYVVSRPKQQIAAPPPPPPPVPQGGGGGGTDWGAMVAGIAGAATTIAGMFA